MGKLKNLEKKPKAAVEFDKKTPDVRVKSIKDEKAPKKGSVQKKSDAMSQAKKSIEIQKARKKKKVKILTQIKQEVEANAKKIDSKGVSEDESKLVAREIVKKAIIAVKDGIQKEAEKNTSKNLFDDELRIGMQVIAVKIPVCPPHARKILLTHSLFEEYPDVCFFIRDSKPKKADQDETVREFKEKLDAAGVTCKQIMTVTQLKQNYNTHNLKLKLCNLYDVFLVESEIAEHVYTVLGKHFLTKRKRPIQVSTKKTAQLKEAVEKAIKKVNFRLNANSNISCFEVGTIKMDNVKIADNIMNAIEQLKEKWPGSWRNINRLFLKPMRLSKVSIPIFYSNINPNEVEVPVIKGDKVNRLEKLAGELKSKAKKLKLDLKTKKLLKVKQEKQVPVSAEKTPVAVTPTEESPKKKKKKSKKTSESVDVIPLSTEPPAKKGKKNKKEKEATTEIVVQEQQQQQQPIDEEPPKKKKKGVKLEAIAAVDTQQQTPELEEEPIKKSKNKKKSKIVDKVTDDTAMASEKEQVLKKKKKNKKNKA